MQVRRKIVIDLPSVAVRLGGIQYDSTSHCQETCDLLHILKQSSDEDVRNCGNCSEVYASDSDDSVSSVINLENEETEETTLGDTRTMRHRFEEQSDWK
jgi:hypothetical protein